MTGKASSLASELWMRPSDLSTTPCVSWKHVIVDLAIANQLLHIHIFTAHELCERRADEGREIRHRTEFPGLDRASSG